MEYSRKGERREEEEKKYIQRETMRRGELHGRGVGKLDRYTFFTTFFHREYDTQGNETSLAQRRRRGKDWKRIETKDSRLSGAGEERQREREGRGGEGREMGREAGGQEGRRAGGRAEFPPAK